jgi:uncharacterized membrane protein
MVCGYIHTGDNPPDECPVCKAPKSKFVEVDAEGNVIASDKTSDKQPVVAPSSSDKAKTSSGKFTRFILKNHLHPILVHTPNGLIPVIVIFFLIGIFFQVHSMETAAFYNLAVLLVIIPGVMLTGYLEWKKRYKGAKTALFFAKITCSLIVFATILILAGWRFIDPEVISQTSPTRWIFFSISLVMLLAAGIAGHLGGKLVFGSRDT